MRQRKQSIEKELKDSAEKLAEASRKQHQEEDAKAAARIAVVKQSLAFQHDWAGSGHPKVRKFDDMSSASRYLEDGATAKQDVFADPFLVKGVKVGPGKVQTVLTQWLTSFSAHCEKSRCTSAQHELQDSQGAKEVLPLWTPLLAGNTQHDDCMPSCQHMCAQQFLYGYTALHLNFDFEPNYLGTLRLQCHGTTALLLARVADVAARIDGGSAAAEGTVSCARLKDWWQNTLSTPDMTAADLQALSDSGVKVFSVHLSPDELLVTPPGFLVACSSLGEACAYGLRRAFLPKSASARKNLLTVLTGLGAATGPTQTMLRCVVDSLALAAVAKPAAPSAA